MSINRRQCRLLRRLSRLRGVLRGRLLVLELALAKCVEVQLDRAYRRVDLFRMHRRFRQHYAQIGSRLCETPNRQLQARHGPAAMVRGLVAAQTRSASASLSAESAAASSRVAPACGRWADYGGGDGESSRPAFCMAKS